MRSPLEDLGRVGGVAAGHPPAHVGLVAEGRREGRELGRRGKIGLRMKTSGRCMPPSNGSFRMKTSPGWMRRRRYGRRIAAIASGNEPRCNGHASGPARPAAALARRTAPSRSPCVLQRRRSSAVRTMVSAISSAIEPQARSDQLEVDRIDVGSAMRSRPRRMTMLPEASSARGQPGGTTRRGVVLLDDQRAPRAAFGEIGARSSTASRATGLRAEVRRDGYRRARGDGATSAAGARRRGPASAGRRLADDPEAHDLDRSSASARWP